MTAKKNISKLLKYDTEMLERIVPETIPKFFPDINNDYPFLIIENFLSNSQCDGIVKNLLLSGPKKGKATIYGNDINENVRNTFIMNMEDEDKALCKQVSDKVLPEIENFFKVKFIKNEGFHALGYSPGCRFAFHCDNSNYYHEKETGINKWHLNIPDRTISSVLFLTDCVEKIKDFNQCTGGEIVFGFLLDENDHAFSIKPKKGLFIAFPSNPYFAHEVEPVIEGYRVSIVDWYKCEVIS